MPITINDGEDATHVVCVAVTNPLMFPDNVVAKCSVCTCEVQHRPHIPQGKILICFGCLVKHTERDLGLVDKLYITPRTAAEVAEFMQKKTRN